MAWIIHQILFLASWPLILSNFTALGLKNAVKTVKIVKVGNEP